MRKLILSGALITNIAFGLTNSGDNYLLEMLKKPIHVEHIQGGQIKEKLGSKASSSINVEHIKENPLPIYDRFKKPVKLIGKVKFFDALSILMNEGVKIKAKGNISDKDLIVSISTLSISDFVKSICEAADVWCTYEPITKQLTIEKFRLFTVDFTPEGKIVFGIGEAGQGQSGDSTTSDTSNQNTEGASSTSTSQSVSYTKANLSGEEIVSILKKMFNVKFYPSLDGYLMFEATPSQWQKINEYFKERDKRREVVYAEIQLLRVDLNDKFKWGINWSSITKAKLFRGIEKASFGLSAGVINVGDRATVSLLTKAGEEKALITALSQYGKVHKVDSWYYQMMTGTPVPFRNYQLVRYFTVGAVQNNNSTETTVEVNEDEVGFRGVLSLYKENSGYYVDGFIDLSSIVDFITIRTPDGELKAPQIEGKSFRIMTKLPSLNRTLVIGGFRVRGFSSKDYGVPLLSKIPILGYLFKGKENLKQNSEFVVLITLKPSRYGKTPVVEKAEHSIEEGLKR